MSNVRARGLEECHLSSTLRRLVGEEQSCSPPWIVGSRPQVRRACEAQGLLLGLVHTKKTRPWRLYSLAGPSMRLFRALGTQSIRWTHSGNGLAGELILGQELFARFGFRPSAWPRVFESHSYSLPSSPSAYCYASGRSAVGCLWDSLHSRTSSAGASSHPRASRVQRLYCQRENRRKVGSRGAAERRGPA